MNADYLDPSKRNTIVLPDYLGITIKPNDGVLLRGNHPHAGRSGVYKGVDHLIPDQWGALVSLDDGGGCYVFKADQWCKVSR